MGILKQVSDYCNRRITRFHHQRKFWRDGDAFKGSADLFMVLGATKRFIAAEVPALLGLSPSAPIHIELPASGSQSFTVILSALGKKAILRVYPSVKGYIARAHLNGAEMLSQCGVNVPRILYTSAETKQYPVIFILEEFIEGNLKYADDLTQADIGALAVQLARMHSAHNSAWGRVLSVRNDPFFPSLVQRVKRDLAILQQKKIIDKQLADKVLDWSLQWEPAFEKYNAFSLTHNDLQPANAIFTGEGDYYLVDLSRLQWGPAAREVVRCYHRQLDLYPEKIETFNKFYFEALSPEDANSTREFCRFYDVFHRITTLVKSNTKSEKNPDLIEQTRRRQQVFLADISQLITEGGPDLELIAEPQK